MLHISLWDSMKQELHSLINSPLRTSSSIEYRRGQNNTLWRGARRSRRVQKNALRANIWKLGTHTLISSRTAVSTIVSVPTLHRDPSARARVSQVAAPMVKGGGDADVASLASHMATPVPAVQRMAARGIVQLLLDPNSGAAPLPALRRCLVGVGLHSFTFQLNLSPFHGIGGTRRGCVARVKGILGSVRGV
jgi:hypothetical protein